MTLWSKVGCEPHMRHQNKDIFSQNANLEWRFWATRATTFGGALKSAAIRCASFARSSNTSTGSALKRNKTDAKRANHETRKRPERLLEIQFKLRKRLRTASDATCEDRGHVPGDMTLCGTGTWWQWRFTTFTTCSNQPTTDQISLGQIASQI